MVNEKTKGKEGTAGRRKIKPAAFQFEVVCDHHRVLGVFHSRE